MSSLQELRNEMLKAKKEYNIRLEGYTWMLSMGTSKKEAFSKVFPARKAFLKAVNKYMKEHSKRVRS